MEATQVKSETTAVPKEDQTKLPEFKAPKRSASGSSG